MLTVFNSCDNRLVKGTLPPLEKLLWAASLVLYKKCGYKLKLYCKSEDVDALKKECLYELYDEIDTDTFDYNLNSSISEKYFWSYRKMEALKKEFSINNNAVYSDTDILMFSLFDLNCDALFWCMESDPLVYTDWKNISTPSTYRLPQWLKDTDAAYNCGLIWFKDVSIINEWYDEYMRFAAKNPCDVKISDYQNTVLACNSEQRIIKGLCDKYNLNVSCIATAEQAGLTNKGIHLYAYKQMWKYEDLMANLMDTSVLKLAKEELLTLCVTTLECGGYKELAKRGEIWKTQI